jgi:RNA polymerase sigma-70 factor (ECF subfamily)
MREPHSKGLNFMNTTVISENSFEAGWVGRPKAVGGCACFELVKAFGDRLYSIAKHITQNDDAAENVLIETFLEVCSDLDGYQADEKVWLRLVTIAARVALSKLHNRGPGRPLLHRVPDTSEDLMVGELSICGGDDQQRYSLERTTCVLEHGLRSLDPMCRTVFVLRDIEDTSVEHIATIVNRSVAAVKVCLLRARLQLREMLTRQMSQQQRNPDIQIRGIGPPQRDLLITMYDRFDPLGAAFGLPPRTAEARCEWIGSALGQKVNVAAFSPIGEVVGHCFLAADKPASAEMAVFVRQEFRRIGVGTALVKAALDRGGAAGLRHVWSLTPSDNRVALRMQMNCGFRLTKSVSFETELEIDLPAAA